MVGSWSGDGYDQRLVVVGPLVDAWGIEEFTQLLSQKLNVGGASHVGEERSKELLVRGAGRVIQGHTLKAVRQERDLGNGAGDQLELQSRGVPLVRQEVSRVRVLRGFRPESGPVRFAIPQHDGAVTE